MDVFQQHADDKFAVELSADIKNRYPQQTAELDSQTLLSNISAAIKQARSFKLTETFNISMFVELTYTIASDFYHNPQLTLFADPQLSADENFAYFLAHTTNDAWESAKQIDEPGEWPELQGINRNE